MIKKNTIVNIGAYGVFILSFLMSWVWADVPNKTDIKESIQNQLKLLDQMPALDTKIPVGPETKPDEHHDSEKKKEKAKRLRAEIWSEHKDGVPSLVVRFENGLPYPALFKRGDYLYLAFSFPTDIDRKKWSEGIAPEISGLDILQSDDATMVRWKISNVYPKLQIDNKRNEIKVEFMSQVPNNDGYDLEAFQPRHRGDTFRAKLKNAQTDLSFYFDETGQEIWIICADGHNRDIPYHEYPDFDILESYQGVAFELKSDDLECSYVRKSAYINKNGGLGNSLAVTDLDASKLPTIFDDFQVGNPLQQVRDLISRVYSGNPSLEDTIDLIWTYTSAGLALESQGVMHGVLAKNSDLALSYLWKTMTGLNALLRGQYDVAQQNFETIKDEPDVVFWLAIANCCELKGSDLKSITQVLAGKQQLMNLPAIIRDKLWSKILEFGLVYDKENILKEYTLKGDTPTTRVARPIYRLASVYLKLDPENMSAVNSLFDIAKSEHGTKVGVLAAFKRVIFLHDIKKITPEHEFEILNNLRFQWRGDHIEYKISKYLINRYLEEKQYAKLLPVARKIVKYFTKQAHEDGIPQLMQDALVKYFEQEHIPVMEMLSIFQDYTSIAPDSDQGDMVMIKATNVLANLALYDVVVNLLRDYLSQKAKEGPEAQHRRDKILYRMAVAYHLDRKFKDALKTLDEIKNPPTDLVDDMAILKSEAYLQSGHQDKALAALGNSEAQLIHKAEILLGDRKWSQAQQIYHDLIYGNHKLTDSGKESCLVDYALCLFLDKQTAKLSALHDNFTDFMKGKKGDDAFELLTVPDAKVSLTQLQSIQQVETFTNRLKTLFEDPKK